MSRPDLLSPQSVLSPAHIAGVRVRHATHPSRHQEFPGLEPNKEGLKQFVLMFHGAFSDLKVETLGIGVDGDELWVHLVMTGTHTGEFAGIPATGKKVSLPMMDRVKTRDGKAVEHWGLSDDLGMMTQLGVIPEMG